MSARAAPYLAFLAASTLWGSTFLVIKMGTEAAPPFWSIAARLVLATLILLAVGRATGAPWPRGSTLRAALGFGFLEFGLSMAALYWAETLVPSGIAAVLFATAPLATALFARAHRLEGLTAVKVGAAVVAAIGVALIVGGEVRAAVPWQGLAALVVAVLGASYAGIALQLAPPQNPVMANGIGAAIGAAAIVPLAAVTEGVPALPFTLAVWGPILYLTVAGSLLAFVLFAWLLNQWPASSVSFIGVTVPVIALALGVAVAGERPSMGALIGAATVLVSVAAALTHDALRNRRLARARRAAAPR